MATARGKRMAAEKTSSRGSSSTLDIVKQYLLSGQCPAGYSKNDKRALKRRAQSFVLFGVDLYYTCGRSRHSNGEAEETAENPESYPDYTQVLRKCLLTEEERQEALTRAHIGEDGQHFGMERTTERVASQFYWLGVIYSVRNMIHNCGNCASRSRGAPAVTTTVLTIPSHDCDDTNGEEECVKIEKMDAFLPQSEASTYFWQRVEVQVFGPYPVGKDKDELYVAIALDTFSQFPEAVIMPSVTMASLTNFILSLVCRYGVMEKLVMLQNQATKSIDLTINAHDVYQAGITFTQIFTLANPTDARWKQIDRNLERFVSFYPTLWDKCLEAFMVPLRISLPSEADYTPSYLTFGREPNLPEQLNHRSKEDWQQTEMRLSQEQEHHTVDLLMRAFGLHSNAPSVPSTNVKEVSHLVHGVTSGVNTTVGCMHKGVKPGQPSSRKQDASSDMGVEAASVKKPVKKRGRPSKGTKRNEMVEEDIEADSLQAESEGIDISAEITAEDVTASPTEGNQETPGIRSSKRKRTMTYKVQEVLQSRRQRQKPTSTNKVESTITQTVADQCEEQASSETAGNSSKRVHPPRKASRLSLARVRKVVEAKQSRKVEASAKIASVFEQLALDVYYFILKQFREQGVFPSYVSATTMQAVQQLGQSVELRDGQLYSCVGKSAGRIVVTKEKARFSLLRKAHVRGEMHYDRNTGLRHLLDMNVFWKGMSLDLDAFIHACPECIAHNPTHNKAQVQIPSKSKVLAADRDDIDPHLSEDEEEESSYEDLIQYLTDGTFSTALSEDQQSRIKLRATSFCIINGSLHYQAPYRTSVPPCQVLFAESCRQTAILEAHIEEGSHLSQQDTQAKLREKYFWSGMTYDVIRYIATCCLVSSQPQPIPHRNPIIQKRVEKFCKYHCEGIPVFDGSILRNSPDSAGAAAAEEGNVSLARTEDKEGETSLSDQGGTSVSNSDPSTGLPQADGQQHQHNFMEEEVLRKAVESIIAEVGGTSYADPEDNAAVQTTPSYLNLTKSGRRRSRRDCHKCDHCGRVISGSVAFKAHLYKHTGIKPFNCNACGKTFTTKKSQQVHMRKHTGVRPYLCNQCGREFFRITSFRYHLKSHTRGKLTPLPCDQCSRTFATQNRLERHKEFKHPTVPRVHMCNQCGKVFTAARSLKWHEQTHSGVRKHPCQYCNKRFVRKEVLVNHLKIHSAAMTEEWEALTANHAGEHQPESVGELTVTISQPGGEVLTISARESVPEEVVHSVIHWGDDENHQAADAITQQNLIVTDINVYHHAQTSQNEHTTTHVLTAAQVHPHTSMHLAPSTVPLPTHTHPSIHTLHPADILLHEAVPVQYEVECLSGDPSALMEADLNAVHMLAHASLSGQNIMQHLSDRT